MFNFRVIWFITCKKIRETSIKTISITDYFYKYYRIASNRIICIYIIIKFTVYFFDYLFIFLIYFCIIYITINWNCFFLFFSFSNSFLSLSLYSIFISCCSSLDHYPSPTVVHTDTPPRLYWGVSVCTGGGVSVCTGGVSSILSKFFNVCYPKIW